MNPLGVTVVLGLLVGAWAQLVQLEMRPACDSLEAEAAALVAQEYLNAMQNHGYKYALNRIEDIKVLPQANGQDIYLLEVDLLETDCHVLDPTPVANCMVRPKRLTAVEGDCDVVLRKVGGALTVTAFKCKTEESTEDLCLGCPRLLALNDTAALDFVSASLASLNNLTDNVSFALWEVGRMSTQVVSGGFIYTAEYAVVEANCTGGNCVPLADKMAQHGFCTAKGSLSATEVGCKIFPSLMTLVDVNNTAAPVPAQPPVNVHPGLLTVKHGLRHHKLTAIHDPELSGLLSAESSESSEVVPVARAVPVLVAAVPAAAQPVLVAAVPAAAQPVLVAAVPAAAQPVLVAAVPAAAQPVLVAVVPAAAEPAAVVPAAVEPAAVVPAAAVPAAVEPAAVEPASSATDSVAVAAAPVVVVKRQAPDAAAAIPAIQAVPILLVPLCPGKKKHY